MAMLAVGGDDGVGRLERLHRADRHRLLADVEVKEAADLLLRVQLRALLLEAADPDHLPQELEAVRAVEPDLRGAMSHRLQRRQIAFGQAELARFKQAPHDLARSRARKIGADFDPARRDRGAEPFARVPEDRPFERVGRLEARASGSHRP
jgi:hypothetical protein